MQHRADGVCIGTDGAGGNRDLDALVQCTCIDGCRAAAGVAKAQNTVGVDVFGEMAAEYVDTAHDVPDALTDHRSAEQKCTHRCLSAVRAVRCTARFAEAALFDGDGTNAFLDGARTEIAVAAVAGFLVSRVLRTAEGDVHSLGVTLQAEHDGERSCSTARNDEVTGNRHTFLGDKAETDFTRAHLLIDAVKLDLHHRFRCVFGNAVHAEQGR